MSQPVYFTVVADYKAFIEDASTDSDYNPQSVPVGGTVVFQPLVNSGDVVRALDAEPRPVGYIPTAVTAIIDPSDGRLKLRTTADAGGTGTYAPVRLLTGAGLELDGPLFYRVTFSNIVYANNRRGSIASFVFEAPSVDTEVNLISVGRAAGQAAANLVRPTVDVGTVTTGAPGSAAAVTNSGTSTAGVFDFTIPRGDTGAAATVEVGTVSTGNAGSSAAVTNTGTSGAAVLNFTIPRGDTGTVSVGTVSTGNAGSSATVTNSGTPGAAVLNFTIPRGDTGAAATVAVGTVSTGNPGSSVTVTNSGTSGAAVLNFTIPRGDPGEVTFTGVQTLTNKTMSGASNTFSDIPANATPNAARLVCTTAYGGNGVEDGANTWAKIASFTTSLAYQSANVVLVLTAARASSAGSGVGVVDAVILNVNAASDVLNGNLVGGCEVMAGGGASGRVFSPDGFKLIGNGWGNPVELWVRKGLTYGHIRVYELSRSLDSITLTYNASATWQSAIPSGTALNITSNGVTAFGVPVVTTTGTQTLTGKTLTSPKITTSLLDTNGATMLGFTPTASADNYLTIVNSANDWVGLSAAGAGTNIPLFLQPKGNSAAVIYVSTGQTPTLRAEGQDTNHNLNLTSKGTGTVQANGVPVVTTTGTQSLSNKTLTSPTITGSAANTPFAPGFTLPNSAKVIGGGAGAVIDPCIASASPSILTYYANDLAFADLMGGSITYTLNGSAASMYGGSTGTEVLRPNSAQSRVGMAATTDVLVIEVTVGAARTTQLRYGTSVGISMSATPYCARNVKIETYDSVTTTWTTQYDVADVTTSSTHLAHNITSGANEITKIRFTLTNKPDGSPDIRISQIFAVNYQSELGAGQFLSRGGGTLWGTNAAPPAITAGGGDTNISLNLVPKGTGTVNAAGVPVVTTTGAQTLSNKTLSSPTINSPKIDTPKIDAIKDANGNSALTISATASAVNYFTLTNSAAGSGISLYASGSDTNISLNVIPKGTGTLQSGGVDVVTKSFVSYNTTGTLLAASAREYIYLFGSSAVPTLPTAVGNTSIYHLKATTAAITVTTTSSQTIDGNAGLVIQPKESYTLVSDNTNWWII